MSASSYSTQPWLALFQEGSDAIELLGTNCSIGAYSSSNPSPGEDPIITGATADTNFSISRGTSSLSVSAVSGSITFGPISINAFTSSVKLSPDVEIEQAYQMSVGTQPQNFFPDFRDKVRITVSNRDDQKLNFFSLIQPNIQFVNGNRFLECTSVTNSPWLGSLNNFAIPKRIASFLTETPTGVVSYEAFRLVSPLINPCDLGAGINYTYEVSPSGSIKVDNVALSDTWFQEPSTVGLYEERFSDGSAGKTRSIGMRVDDVGRKIGIKRQIFADGSSRFLQGCRLPDALG